MTTQTDKLPAVLTRAVQRRAALTRLARAAAVALGAALLAPVAHAQSSPYYLGVSEALAYESNLYRLADGQATPNTVKSRSDTVSITSLIAGIDQNYGRQRYYGSAAVRMNRYASNDALNNESYTLNLGLDWQTIERISGSLAFASSRSLRKFDPNENSTNQLAKNLESINQIDAVARVGVVTRLTAEAGINWRQVGYSSSAYRNSEYDQVGGSVGLRYRVGGATTVGAALRTSKANYGAVNESRTRNDLDLTASWVPSAISSLQGRLSYGNSRSNLSSSSAFDGWTGELRGTWQATGKILLTGRLLHEIGQDSAFQRIDNTVVASNDFSRTTTSLQFNADYALSSRISLTGGLGIAGRDLSQSTLNSSNTSLQDGNDTTTTLSLGARWRPTRAILVGCDASVEKRSVSAGLSSSVSAPYGSNGLSCFGQFTLQ